MFVLVLSYLRALTASFGNLIRESKAVLLALHLNRISLIVACFHHNLWEVHQKSVKTKMILKLQWLPISAVL